MKRRSQGSLPHLQLTTGPYCATAVAFDRRDCLGSFGNEVSFGVHQIVKAK